MAAMTADGLMPHKGTPTKLTVKAITGDVFYKNALVYADATTGKAQVSVPAAGDVFIGICAEQVTTTAQNDPVDIYIDGVFAMAIETPAEGDVGDTAVVDISDAGRTDNQTDAMTGTDATLAANDILLGKILAIDAEETGRAWVQIEPGWIYSTTLGWV